MPYFKNKDINVLVIHIPKTGGSSLEFYFSKKYNIPLNPKAIYMWPDAEQKQKIATNSSLQHLTYETIIKYQKEFNIDMTDVKIITIVRNPYERLISDLFHWRLITNISTKEEVFDKIKTYVSSTKWDNHNIPQYLFITTGNKQLIKNVIILRTETLTKDMHKLGYNDFARVDNPNLTKNTENLTKKLQSEDYYKYLNNDSIKLINDFYDYDFKLFNYTKKIVH